MRKLHQVVIVWMLAWITFFPPQYLSAESLENGCKKMAFHISVIKAGDESIEGTAEYGSEIELEIGSHNKRTSADDAGHFEFDIESLKVSEGESVTLLNGEHGIDTEVMEEEAEDTVIESVLQEECEVPEESAEEKVQEDESDKSEEASGDEELTENLEPITNEAEEIEEVNKKEVLETTEEKDSDEALEQSEESEIDEEESTEELTTEEASRPTVSEETSETEEITEEEAENESLKTTRDSDGTDKDEMQEADHEALEEAGDDEDSDRITEEPPEISEASTDEHMPSLFSVTASTLDGCLHSYSDDFDSIDESCLQAEVEGKMLTLTYNGRGEVRQSNPNEPDIYINFYLPQEISGEKDIDSMKGYYIVPTAGQSGATKEGELEVGFGENLHHISVNINSILHNSTQERAEYKFTIKIKLNSLPETETGQYVFHAGISEGSRGSQSDDLPQAKIDAPQHPGQLKFHEVPDSMAFETTNIEASTEEVLVKRDEDWKMTVEDTRGAGSDFHVTAEITQPLTTRDGTYSLPEALVYVDEDGHSQSIEEASKVFSETTGNEPLTSLSWAENEGLMIQVAPITVKAEEYKTTVNWTLNDGP